MEWQNKIETVSSGCYYEHEFMKIKFNSNDDLPLNKRLKFHLMIIAIRSVFEEDGKLYPQAFLDDTLYQLNVLKRCFIIFSILNFLLFIKMSESTI